MVDNALMRVVRNPDNRGGCDGNVTVVRRAGIGGFA